MLLDPINDPANEDLTDVESCHQCGDLIYPGKEQRYEGWYYHHQCQPAQPERDTCDSCGTTDHLWRPFRSPRLYCLTCIPDPTQPGNSDT